MKTFSERKHFKHLRDVQRKTTGAPPNRETNKFRCARANYLGIVTEFCYFENVQRQFVNENIGREHETPRVLIVTR